MGTTLGKHWLMCQSCDKPFYPLVPRQSLCLSCIAVSPIEMHLEKPDESLHTIAVRRHRLYNKLFRMDTLIQLKRDSLQLHYLEAIGKLQTFMQKELDGIMLSPAEQQEKLNMKHAIELIADANKDLDALGMDHVKALRKAHSARSVLLEQLEDDIYDTIIPEDTDPLVDLYKSCE